MKEVLISHFIEVMGGIGLNYEFMNSGYEFDMWIDGMLTTLLLVAVTIPISLFFGVLFAAALTSGKRWLSVPVRGYVELTRNTPTLVQLMCGFLVLNMLISNAIGGAQNNPLTPFFWIVAITSLHIAALHAEALRAGIEAVPATTIEAARAIGFNSMQILVNVELPLATRTALPAIINNLVNLVKLSTVGSAIAVGEITYASILIWTQRDNVVELMLVILLFFSAINFTVARIGLWFEKRLAVPGFGQ
ncbi:amino acid ABC transporter permease [Paraburkholderia aspalathi]|nr:amino acid ABC transporter permease [Paraburkholderia aspalathi]